MESGLLGGGWRVSAGGRRPPGSAGPSGGEGTVGRPRRQLVGRLGRSLIDTTHPFDATVGETDAVLDQSFAPLRVDILHENVAVNRPLDVSFEPGPPAFSQAIPYEPSIAGDRVVIQETLEVLCLELEILVQRVGKRILARDRVEEAHRRPCSRASGASTQALLLPASIGSEDRGSKPSRACAGALLPSHLAVVD